MQSVEQQTQKIPSRRFLRGKHRSQLAEILSKGKPVYIPAKVKKELLSLSFIDYVRIPPAVNLEAGIAKELCSEKLLASKTVGLARKSPQKPFLPGEDRHQTVTLPDGTFPYYQSVRFDMHQASPFPREPPVRLLCIPPPGWKIYTGCKSGNPSRSRCVQNNPTPSFHP